MSSDTLRILHVVPSYLPAVRYGGPVYAVHALCRHLVEQGHQVDVYTTNVDGQGVHGAKTGQRIAMDGVGVHYFPVQFPRRLYYSPKLAKFLDAHIARYDLLHLHSVFLYPTLAAARCAHNNGIPYLVAPRGMLVKDLIRRKNTLLKQAWIHLFERRTLEQAAAIHVTSRLEAQELHTFNFVWPEIIELPNGLDPVPAQPAIVRDPNLILFLGRITWKKGLDRLIPALAGLPKLKLFIAGNDETGYTQELKHLAQRHAVTERIVFCGPVRGADKWQLYQQAGVFVLPSYSENFANTVLEAMAMACPVVVTPQVGLADVVKQGGAGIVSAGDVRSLQDAILNILEHRQQAQLMGEAGQRVVAERFSWPTIVSAVENTYRHLRNPEQVQAHA